MDLAERIVVENARLHRLTKQLSLTVSCVLTVPTLLCILSYCWPRSDARLALIASSLTVAGLSLFAAGGLLVAALVVRRYGKRHLVHQLLFSDAMGAGRSGASRVPTDGENAGVDGGGPGIPWYGAGTDGCDA
jgi:hypothetical protein